MFQIGINKLFQWLWYPSSLSVLAKNLPRKKSTNSAIFAARNQPSSSLETRSILTGLGRKARGGGILPLYNGLDKSTTRDGKLPSAQPMQRMGGCRLVRVHAPHFSLQEAACIGAFEY